MKKSELRQLIREEYIKHPLKEDISPAIQKLCDTVNKFSNDGNYNRATLEIAKFSGNTKYITILNAIITISNIENSTPGELIKYRSTVLNNKIYPEIRNKYGYAAVDQIKDSFQY